MSEKHYPYIGGSFDRIIFDGDGSVWVPEPENAKLRRFAEGVYYCRLIDGCDTMCPLSTYNPNGTVGCTFSEMADELGLEPNEYGDEG